MSEFMQEEKHAFQEMFGNERMQDSDSDFESY